MSTSISFILQSYSLQVGVVGSNSIIRLNGGPRGPGFVDTAHLYFVTAPSQPNWVVHFGEANPNGSYLIAYVRDSLFDRIYHLLQAEKPLRLRYEYEEGEVGATLLVGGVSILTGDSPEPLGEGQDADAAVLALPTFARASVGANMFP